MKTHIRTSKDTTCMSTAPPPDLFLLLSFSLLIKASACTEMLRRAMGHVSSFFPGGGTWINLSFSPAPVSWLWLCVAGGSWTWAAYVHFLDCSQQSGTPKRAQLRRQVWGCWLMYLSRHVRGWINCAGGEAQNYEWDFLMGLLRCVKLCTGQNKQRVTALGLQRAGDVKVLSHLVCRCCWVPQASGRNPNYIEARKNKKQTLTNILNDGNRETNPEFTSLQTLIKVISP